MVTVLPPSLTAGISAASCGWILRFSSISYSFSQMCEKMMRPTYVRASVGSRMSGSWLRATTSVFFCAWAARAFRMSAASAPTARHTAFLVTLMVVSFRRGPGSRLDPTERAQRHGHKLYHGSL